MNTTATRTSPFVRQPLSTLGKIAVWAFLIPALMGGLGAVVLTIMMGSPSQDIVVTTASMLAGGVLVATGLRWTPVVASVLGAYLLYMVFTEPFALESLANPKGPNGGFGHFVGVVIVCACTLVAFGASIGVTLQNYCGESRRAPRWLPAALSAVAGMIIGALSIGALSQPVAATAMTTGNGTLALHMSAGNFLQPSVTVAKGSKLMLVGDTTSLHVIANGSWQHNVVNTVRESGAPIVNNVRVTHNSIEVGPFTAAGTYHFYCAVHPGMNLTTIVQ
ncbi:MAG: hypothetical protein H0X37_24905 [Herpetosiphonaceae bacterium]|nr:hypothetical protein [Herpetosiphonaceae bacterium]